MSAKTAVEVKARLLDLTTGVLELVRDGNRDAESVCEVLQIIKEDPLFANRFFADVSSRLQDWQSFYKKFLGIDLDFSSVRIPDRRQGFDRLLVIAQDITPNRVYEVCEQHGIKCWRYADDLDASVTHNDRNPTEHYAIWVRDRVEADEELKNISANGIKAKNIATETLTERLLHELAYWHETKSHLDVNNITLCTGSRFQYGDVPYVGWFRHSSKVHVSYCDPDYSSCDLRSREVVS